MANKITLKQIQTFLAVAETGGFRRAGERLFRSQSSISAQLQQLEAALGVRLFDRTTRQLRLTTYGRDLMARSRKALDEIDFAINEIRDEVQLRKGRVSIASSPSIAGSRLPSVIAEFEQRYPDVVVRIREAYSGDMLDLLHRREIDFAIGPSTLQVSDLIFAPIFSEEYKVIIPDAFGLRARQSVDCAEIAEYGLIGVPTAAEMRRALAELFAAQGVTLRFKYEVLHNSTVLQMAEAGLGIAILPDINVDPSRLTHCHVASLSRPALRRTVCLISHKHQAMTPVAERFADMVRERLPPAGH